MKYVFFTAILAILITISTFFQKDRRVLNSEPVESTLISDADLFSYNRTATSNEDYASALIGQAKKGAKVQVMEEGILGWYKVLLPNGTMGWVQEENLEPSKSALTKNYSDAVCKIYTTSKPIYKNEDEVVKDIKSREYLERLGETQARQVGGGVTIEFTKVRASDGSVGWISENYLERVGWKQPRLIDRRVWRYNKDPFVKKWQGKNIGEFTEKFAEPYAIKNDGENKIYFFNNIYLYGKNHKELGIQAVTHDGTIEEFKYTGANTIWIGYFPLSQTLRSSFLMNTIFNVFDISGRDSYDEYGDKINIALFSMPDWLTFIWVIIVIISYCALFYLIMYIPYFIANKITHKISLNRKLANSIILGFAILFGIGLGYPFFVFCNVNIGVFNNYPIIHFLFVLGMTIGFIQLWNTDLKYTRCGVCRYWSGIHNGSKLASKRESTTTYTDGLKERGTKEVWIDYRLCNRPECHHEWHIVRTVYSGRYR